MSSQYKVDDHPVGGRYVLACYGNLQTLGTGVTAAPTGGGLRIKAYRMYGLVVLFSQPNNEL